MKNQNIRCAVALLFCLAIGYNSAHGQTSITFRVNIADLTKEQSFDPERDRVELIGNLFPLSATQPIILEQNENNSDIFSKKVEFPANTINQSVEYQFRVRLNHSYRNEDIPRTLWIPQHNSTLDAIYFNSYTW